MKHHQVDFLIQDGDYVEFIDNAQYSTVGRGWTIPTKKMRIYQIITDAREHNLEREVVSTAKEIIDKNPYGCLLDAYQQAFKEWIK